MKVKCDFCGTMMNDTESVCPSCGAPNASVRRSSGDQPLTIEELKKWYESKGLPPENVTRFFIGKNVREPKAFGVYFEEESGNYIVYKNKASGERAVRYRGTDQAYAVNELFQRLKQEITQQKMRNVKQAAGGTGGKRDPKADLVESGKTLGKGCIGCLVFIVGSVAAIFVLMIALGLFLMRNDPSGGYYTYDNTCYYYSTRSYADLNWFRYDGEDWQGPLDLAQVPDPLETKKSSKPYFTANSWDSGLPCPDFGQSVYGQDMQEDMYVSMGYYRCGDLYYHLNSNYNEDWFLWTDQWEKVDFAKLPKELRHPSLAKDCLVSQTYTSSLGAGDFDQSLVYRDSQASKTASRGYYRIHNKTYYHQGYFYDDEWYSYDDQEGWQPIEHSAMPEELHHPSMVQDFYYTDTWDPATQTADFADSEFYEAPKANDSGSNSDSDFNWDSGDSWDSGDTDWDSDW